MSGQYNSASDYLRSLSEMSDGNYTSFYRSLSGQLMFPESEDAPAAISRTLADQQTKKTS